MGYQEECDKKMGDRKMKSKQRRDPLRTPFLVNSGQK